jgi:hypothetical protein
MNSEQSRAKLTHWVLIAGLVGILPLLIEQTGKLWGFPYWRFFPLAWSAFVLYIMLSPKVGMATSPLRRTIALVLSSIGVGIGFVSTIVWSPSFGQLAAILLISGWALLILAVVPWTRVIAFTGFLWITWPIPGGFCTRLLSNIHSRAMSVGSNILDLFGTTHLLNESRLDLRSQQIDLTSLMATYDSVYSLFFLAVIVVVGLHCSLFMSLLILASVPLISWMGTVTQFLIHVWVAELATDWTTNGYFLGGMRVVLVCVCRPT